MRDVAELAQVSTATVSRVINHPDKVNANTVRRVQEALRLLSYSPNVWAQATASTNPLLIGLVLPDITNPFFSAIYVGLNEMLRSHGIALWMIDSQNNTMYEREALTMFQRFRAQGVVLIPAHSSANLPVLRTMNTALCLVDRKLTHSIWDMVMIDNFNGARQATQLLIDSGHHRIAIITGPKESTSAAERYKGFVDTLKQNKVPLLTEYIQHGDFRQYSGFALGKKLLNLPVPPTAIFSCNNLMTMGLLEAIHDTEGSVLGESVAIVGFDEIPVSTLMRPGLSVVSSPTKALGTEAARLILARMENPDKGQETVLVSPQLIIRGSEKLVRSRN